MFTGVAADNFFFFQAEYFASVGHDRLEDVHDHTLCAVNPLKPFKTC